jgi:hypothetical protein
MGMTNDFSAALLLRQALERALDQFWLAKMPAMEALSWRVQLIALPFYAGVDGRNLAETVEYTWYRLSEFCHHDAYELPPPKHEIERAAITIEEFAGLAGSSSVSA